MRYVITTLIAFILAASSAYSQSISHQGWQTQTISSGTITVSCAALILPIEKGSLLVETSPTTVRGEMDSSLRAAHPIRVLVQPESGTSDILTTISGCNIDGAVIQLAISNASYNITIQHNPGAIQFVDELDFSLDDIAKTPMFVRKNGIWVPHGVGGGGGSSGGNIIMSGDQRIDFSGMTLDGINKGLIVPMAVNCAFATTLGQFCYNHVTKIIYIGTGTGIAPIAGEGVSGCFGLDDCFDLGQTIDGLNGRANALKLLDSNNDGVLIYVDANGLVFECVNSFGSVSESACKPTEAKYFSFTAGRCSPDGTYFQRNFDQVLNGEVVPTTLSLIGGSHANARFGCTISMPEFWDGEIFTITSYVHTLEPTPGGILHLDWMGYCVDHGATNATAGYPASTVSSEMAVNFTGLSQHALVITPTSGNIPLTGCTGNNPKTLWIRAQLSTGETTADNLDDHHFFDFQVKYGLKFFP